MTEILFYQDKKPTDNGYFLHDILNWPDYYFEIEHSVINWLFPNPNNINIEIFKKDKKIRKNVLKATSRLLNLFGFKFSKNGVKQIKPLNRKENDTIVGLYSERNYKTVVKMMIFLNEINMKFISCLIMLAMCYAMNTDSFLKNKVKKSGYLQHWLHTQKYTQKNHICKFTGLTYTGNSCYQDSVLLALFAIPNNFINKNILEKDIKYISSLPNREIFCGKHDYETRKGIQNELNNITKSMRNNKVKYCSNLRALIKSCPSASKQQFHGTGTQDAGEFLLYLFSIFQVQGTIRKRKTIVTNDLLGEPKKISVVNSIKEHVSPVILISPITLLENSILNINADLLSDTEDAIFDKDNAYKKDGKKYYRRIEEKKIKNADFLVFYAMRLLKIGNKHERIYTDIIPVEKLQLKKSLLNLYAIVVHEAVHYTCYIKCDENWFYYNDMDTKIVFVGSFKDMLNDKNRPNIKTHGVLYFYTI